MEISDAEYQRLLHRSRLMDLAQDILLVLEPDGTIADVNEAAARLHGGTAADFIGRNCADFLDADSATEMLRVAIGMHARGHDCNDRMSLVTTRHDGAKVDIELRVSWSQAQQKFYVVERDVTEHVQVIRRLVEVSQELRHQARTDSLTGIANRTVFEEAIEEVELADIEPWLVLVDIDEFKWINDTHGHLAGDTVLVAVARELQRHAGQDSLVARLGGDEFAILLPCTTESDFVGRLARLREFMETTVELEDQTLVSVSYSLGSARRESGEASTGWLRRADRELYSHKRSRHQLAA